MNEEILRLAVPNILTNLTVPLLGMVDLHLMGHLNSTAFMGSVALGGVIFNFVYWGFAFYGGAGSYSYHSLSQIAEVALFLAFLSSCSYFKEIIQRLNF